MRPRSGHTLGFPPGRSNIQGHFGRVENAPRDVTHHQLGTETCHLGRTAQLGDTTRRHAKMFPSTCQNNAPRCQKIGRKGGIVNSK